MLCMKVIKRVDHEIFLSQEKYIFFYFSLMLYLHKMMDIH